MKKRTLKTKYPVFLSFIFQSMRQIWCNYRPRTEQESMLRKLLFQKEKKNKQTQNHLIIQQRPSKQSGHCSRYDLSVECTLKLKQSQPSPPTLATARKLQLCADRPEERSACPPTTRPLRHSVYTARSLAYFFVLNVLGCQMTYQGQDIRCS